MHTGCTAPIYEGEEDYTFKKFAMRCARNFGALAEFRDRPLDEEIDFEKEMTPPTYYRDALAEEKANYEKFLANRPTEEQLGKEYDVYVERANKKAREINERNAVVRERCENMLQKVEAWQPPTSEHEGLKDFMIKQLKESIDFDCAPYSPHIETKEEYIAYYQSEARFLEDIKVYEELYRKEMCAFNKRKQWVLDLVQSLKEEKE